MVEFTRPNYLQAGDSSLTRAAMHGIGASQPPHIEITGGKFTLLDAAGTPLKVIAGAIDVIVLDANEHISKAFYDRRTPYDPTNPQPPLCVSDNGVAPSRQAREPQSQTCAMCPNNVWGSATGLGGNKIKACKDYKKIAVYCVQEKSMQFLLRIPPNSFSYWNAYCGFLGANHAELWQVITRVAFSPDPKEPATLTFAVAEHQGQVMWVPQSFEAWYRERLEQNVWADLIGRNDQPIDGSAQIGVQAARPAIQQDKPLPPARPAQIVQQAPQAAQSPVEAVSEMIGGVAAPPPAPRRGRPPTRQQPAPQNGPAPAAQADGFDAGPDLPAFLDRTSPGMVEAPQPDAGLSAALDSAFGLSTKQ